MIFAIIIIVLMAISLGVPWYRVEYKSSSDGYGSGSTSIEYSLTEFRIESGDSSASIEYTSSTFDHSENFKAIHYGTLAIGLVALIFVIFALVFTVLSVFKGFGSKLLFIFALIAVIMCFVAPIIYAVGLPEASYADCKKQESDYGGDCKKEPLIESKKDSDEYGTTETLRYPYVGWFLSLTCGILGVPMLLAVRKLPKGQVRAKGPYTAPAYTPPPQPQYGYQQPPAQQPQQYGYPPQQQY